MTAIFGWPLGWIMYFFYNILPVYVVALTLFTLFTKVCMVPLAIKQQKGMVKTQIFQPKIAELQKKYGNNKEKLNVELQKLYTEEGYNPMSGCLPLLIQFPIIMGLYNVIQNPLTHLLRIPKETIDAAAVIATNLMNDPKINLAKDASAQIKILSEVQGNPGAFSSLGQSVVDSIINLNLTLGPIDLTQQPLFNKFDILWVIPIVSALTALGLSLLTAKQTGGAVDNPSAASTQRTMTFIVPLMSGYFGFILPAGVGVYWILSNIFAAIQAFILGRVMNPKELAEKEIAAREAKKAVEREEKREARRKAREMGLDIDMAKSQKEINRMKLAQARRRDAEKYGEEYIEVTDDDLKS